MAIITNLISYWKFDVDNATQVDSHGSNDGAVTGATFDAGGLINNCYSFDGVNDEVRWGDILDPGTSAWSASCWFKTSDKGAFKLLVGKTAASGGGEWEVRVTSDDVVEFNIFEGAVKDAAVGVTDVTDGEWHHAVATRPAAGGNDIIYIDGSSDGTGTNNQRNSTNALDFTVGISDQGVLDMNGLIDEVGVWDKELTPTEVSQLYNAGAGLAYPFVEDGLTMVSPNGGESVDAVSVHEITWSDTGTIVNVKLEYSLDNGSVYTTIIESTSNDNSFNWDVPNVRSTEALIRISDASDGDPVDVSDAVFRILEAQDADRPNTGKGTRGIATRYPVTSGLVAGTTKQAGRQSNLVPEQGSLYPRRKKVGFR